MNLIRGLVVSNKDPHKIGRLQIKIPQLWGDEVFERWVYPCFHSFGDNKGIYIVPSEGDVVWLLFENNEVSEPVWIGGHQARKSDKVSKEQRETENQILIQQSANQFIQINEDSNKITIKQGNAIGEINIINDSTEINIGQRIEFRNRLQSFMPLMNELFAVLLTIGALVDTITAGAANAVTRLTAIQIRFNQLFK